ncbi:MAG: phosphoribosylformylglycinamidine synthase [Muribaculaceae bacterium]|nr:phosphoribosylformylglycinamidine synthase [Muribaculaceae bacterium]
MVVFFKKGPTTVYAVESDHSFDSTEKDKLKWLLGGARAAAATSLAGRYVGPRKEMITPWSTNAVEITQNMGLSGISRIEEFRLLSENEEASYDPMLQHLYAEGLSADIFAITAEPEDVVYISDIPSYNREQGLALSPEEESYLSELSARLGRPLTDSEVFGFSQVNSEHCRHKIFNGTFVIDGKEKPVSLFKLIKRTSQENPNGLVSAYKDNVAFVKGPRVQQFAPINPDKADYFEERPLDTVISLKAETHNFPTTVEPFNGAATGSGGEIRDRLGGGRASLPIAGTAVYMTSYPRLSPDMRWQYAMNERKWLYQTPAEILIKASNGASDFGNKFGQPLICGSLFTFEHSENERQLAYDKVIMLAGGVGFAAKKDALKGEPKAGQAVVIAGGDNYRIGMGGGAVSSVETGRYANAIELNAVQRANPEMQKRVANVIRALAESSFNPIVSIHDHGAGGHLNALSELIESTGGFIDIDALPVGDPTLSDKEIIGNESQERMGFVIKPKDIPLVERIAERERAPLYVVGKTTDDHRLTFGHKDGRNVIDLAVTDMLGNSPKTVISDRTVKNEYKEVETDASQLERYISDVMMLESVACKDWLTNKVDRSVTGRVARQQCQGEIQLPLSDCGIVALDYHGRKGIATSIGHAPAAALSNPGAGSRLAIAESLTNILGADLAMGLRSVSLSANWMWPCKNPGEDAALYSAVEACSDFACALGINIPTGKDSLSMTQKYGDEKVYAPGTVIISAAAPIENIRRTVGPVARPIADTTLYYIDFSSDKLKLGGSALAQTLNAVGPDAPDVKDAKVFANAFETVQTLVRKRKLLAMHDVSAGGLITTLLEMVFANTRGGLKMYTDGFGMICGEKDLIKILFAENPAVVIQVDGARKASVEDILDKAEVKYFPIATTTAERVLQISHEGELHLVNIDMMRKLWYTPSYLLDRLQSGEACAAERFANYAAQPLKYILPKGFKGTLERYGLNAKRGAERSGVRAAIIREKGVNGDREMAYSLFLAGFDVKDVHMTDIMSGRETLDDVNMIVFCGGFSNSDVLGSAKGWASGFRWNETARETLRRYYAREDTLSLGVCNGCQLMIELNLLFGGGEDAPVAMEHNVSHKFESAFVNMTIPQNTSVMFGSLSGVRTGIWVAHGEGRFSFKKPLKDMNVVGRYSYHKYPGNPNGSTGDVAALASADGRHLAMMPHLERAIFPWQCAYYPNARRNDDVTVWIEAFVNARKWVEGHTR